MTAVLSREFEDHPMEDVKLHPDQIAALGILARLPITNDVLLDFQDLTSGKGIADIPKDPAAIDAITHPPKFSTAFRTIAGRHSLAAKSHQPHTLPALHDNTTAAALNRLVDSL